MNKLSKINKFLLGILLTSLMWINCENGCNCNGCRGCTTRKVVDTEKETRKIDGIKVKVTANKVKYKNRQFKGLLGPNPHINRSIWYAVDYRVKISDRPYIESLCEHPIDEEIDFETYLKDLTVTFSPDKNSVAFGINEKVEEFYHFLKEGSPFPSGYFYNLHQKDTVNQIGNLTLDRINWKIFPNSSELFDSLIINREMYIMSIKDVNIFLGILNEMTPGNKHEILLIKNWYCPIAADLFSMERVQQIVKISPEWKQLAIEKALAIIKEPNIDEFDFNAKMKREKSLTLIISINDKDAYYKADEIMFKNIDQCFEDTAYLSQRIRNLQFPIQEKYKKQISNKAELILAGFPEGNTNRLELSVDILFETKQTNQIDKFITKAFSGEIFIDNIQVIKILTIDRYKKYTPEQQKVIVENFSDLLKNSTSEINYFDLKDIFDFLKEIIPCDESKQIYEKYKEKLGKMQKPKKCN